MTPRDLAILVDKVKGPFYVYFVTPMYPLGGGGWLVCTADPTMVKPDHVGYVWGRIP